MPCGDRSMPGGTSVSSRSPAGQVEADRPGKQERGFEVEHDEQDRDQVEAHVELAARILERGKAALVLAELLGVRVVRPGQASDAHRQEHEQRREAHGNTEEDQDRQILRKVDQAPDSIASVSLRASKVRTLYWQGPRNRFPTSRPLCFGRSDACALPFRLVHQSSTEDEWRGPNFPLRTLSTVSTCCHLGLAIDTDDSVAPAAPLPCAARAPRCAGIP